MTNSGVVFLGIIAVATLVMACVQVGVILFALRLGKRVEALTARVEQEIGPLVKSLGEVSQNAVRASSLASAQVERFDQAFANLTRRLDETFTLVQTAIIEPAREGRAVVSAIRAAVGAFREMRAARARARVEDEDALFIG